MAPPCLSRTPTGRAAAALSKGASLGALGRCGRQASLTLVDGVLRQLAQLAVDHPRVGAQELLLAGR